MDPNRPPKRPREKSSGPGERVSFEPGSYPQFPQNQQQYPQQQYSQYHTQQQYSQQQYPQQQLHYPPQSGNMQPAGVHHSGTQSFAMQPPDMQPMGMHHPDMPHPQHDRLHQGGLQPTDPQLFDAQFLNPQQNFAAPAGLYANPVTNPVSAQTQQAPLAGTYPVLGIDSMYVLPSTVAAPQTSHTGHYSSSMTQGVRPHGSVDKAAQNEVLNNSKRITSVNEQMQRAKNAAESNQVVVTKNLRTLGPMTKFVDSLPIPKASPTPKSRELAYYPSPRSTMSVPGGHPRNQDLSDRRQLEAAMSNTSTTVPEGYHPRPQHHLLTHLTGSGLPASVAPPSDRVPVSGKYVPEKVSQTTSSGQPSLLKAISGMRPTEPVPAPKAHRGQSTGPKKGNTIPQAKPGSQHSGSMADPARSSQREAKTHETGELSATGGPQEEVARGPMSGPIALPPREPYAGRPQKVRDRAAKFNRQRGEERAKRLRKAADDEILPASGPIRGGIKMPKTPAQLRRQRLHEDAVAKRKSDADGGKGGEGPSA